LNERDIKILDDAPAEETPAADNKDSE